MYILCVRGHKLKIQNKYNAYKYPGHTTNLIQIDKFYRFLVINFWLVAHLFLCYIWVHLYGTPMGTVTHRFNKKLFKFLPDLK